MGPAANKYQLDAGASVGRVALGSGQHRSRQRQEASRVRTVAGGQVGLHAGAGGLVEVGLKSGREALRESGAVC